MTTATASTASTASVHYSTILTDKGTTLYVPTRELKLIVGLLKQGRPVALIGEPGSGKTDLARAIVRAAKVDHFHQQEFGGIVSGDLLDGERTLDSDGKLTIIPSEHLKAVRAASKGERVGYVLDELNRGTPQGLNKLLRQYSHNEYSSDIDGILSYNPKNLLSIATLNVGFGFTGTSRMDAALIDRFYPVRLSAPERDIASKILDDRFGTALPAKAKDGILKVYSASRKKEDVYRMGVRDVLRTADGIVHGEMSLVEAIEVLVGGTAAMGGFSEESVEALITVAKSA